VELRNDVVAVGEVTVAASTSSLALHIALALEAEFIPGGVLGDYIVSRSLPVGLEVYDGLVALGGCCLPAGHEAMVGIGVLPRVLEGAGSMSPPPAPPPPPRMRETSMTGHNSTT